MTTEKRSQILQAALALFNEQGFRGTSTAEISKRAGVATGTLFHHFKTKEELIEELYLSAKGELAKHLRAVVNSTLNTKEALRRLWTAFAEWAITNQEQYRFFKHCDASPYISQPVREKAVEDFTFIHEYFNDLAKSRKQDGLSQDLLFDVFTGALEGFIRHLYNNPALRADRSQWEVAFNTCWKGFC